MTPQVSVPVPLLLDQGIGPTAKLIWLTAHLLGQAEVNRPGYFQAHSGLSQPTILHGLQQLRSAGWYPVAPRTHEPSVTLPASLLTDRRLGANAILLYGALQLVPGFRNRAGHFTYRQIHILLRRGLKSIRRAVRDLEQTGWLQTAQANQKAPIHFTLSNPIDAELDVIRRRLARAPFRGEALMREYLSLLVDSDQFEDDAAPGFLVNPLTDERLQLDRYYPPSVAFEYNGPQHYGPTDHYSREEAAMQRGRDYMKLGICVTRGVHLVVVHPEDLSLDGIRRKVDALLPLRNLAGREPLISYLEAASRRYRMAAKRGAFPGSTARSAPEKSPPPLR